MMWWLGGSEVARAAAGEVGEGLERLADEGETDDPADPCP